MGFALLNQLSRAAMNDLSASRKRSKVRSPEKLDR